MFSISFEFYRRDVIVKIILIIFVILSKIIDHMFTLLLLFFAYIKNVYQIFRIDEQYFFLILQF